MTEATKHILVALLEDKPGVLNRMSSVFRRRGFNIESVNVIDTISVGNSELPNLTRVTLVVSGSKAMVTKLKRQLEKIIDVVKVSEIPAEREI
jgi:acetolactate synthase-1/3 small subunit